MLNITNAVTASRILLTPLLYIFAFTRNTAAFALMWVVIGASDSLDGYLARRLKQVSAFGSTLDTIADIFYFGSGWLIFVIFPILRPFWWTFGLVVIFICVESATRLLKKRTSLPHTNLSKLASFSVFLSVLYMATIEPAPWLLGVMLVLLTASFMEKMSILWWS
ncbi:CDP-alcohol phosphatidyltransferase family protein [Candidatus Woesearchaeota archaeon]|nr:CDP-alcohol phosphatidyltransferase family protein [Candidatus Woesearchaeota archaeon]